MKDIVNLMPFVVRVESGQEFSLYAETAAHAAREAEARSMAGRQRLSPAVLVVRADEPFIRNPSRLRRLLDWWES